MAERNFRHLFASLTRDDQQKAASLWLPTERIHQRAAVARQRFHIQDIRAEVKDDVALTQTKIVNRASIVQRQALAINQLPRIAEPIEIKMRVNRRRGHAKAEHLA